MVAKPNEAMTNWQIKVFKLSPLWHHSQPAGMNHGAPQLPGPEFVISIRTFGNADTPELARLWNSHRAEAGIQPPLSVASVEIVVLSRPFFERRNLLIAVDNERPVGFLHWLAVANDTATGVVANVAIPQHAQQSEIAARLMEGAVGAASNTGFQRLLVGQAPEHWTGYAGVGRCGMGGGIPDVDAKVAKWALDASFTPTRHLLTYNLDLPSYRPPFDRDLLAMRRSATVDRRRDITDQPWRIASAMSHMEMHRFVATSRDGQLLAQCEIMVGDPEMMVVSGGTILLCGWQSNPAAPDQSLTALRYTLTGAVSELASERAQHVQATVEADDAGARLLLESVGFQLQHRGTIYTKSLGSQSGLKPVQ